MSNEFVHLHLHSHFSFFESTVRIENLPELMERNGMDAVALTDSGNMFAAIQFYKRLKARGHEAHNRNERQNFQW